MHGQVDRRDGGGAIELTATRRPYAGSWWWLLALVLAALVYLFLLRPDDQRGGDLTVFAAASLRPVMAELEAAWVKAYPEHPLTVVTEASNVLAAQIAEGAEADVFLSADDVRPRQLVEAGHASHTPRRFARNRVTLVTGGDTPIESTAELAEPGTRIVVGGPGTPIGTYTAQAIEALAALDDDPAGFAAAVEANIASREDNVRAALAKVELGEGDAAFVYRTDALGNTETTEVELPPAVHVAADYTLVGVSERAVTHDFIDWLQQPDTRDILAEAGFEVEP